MSAQLNESVVIGSELVPLTIPSPMGVFQDPEGLKPYLTLIRQRLDEFVPVMDTAKGRDEVRSMAMKVAKMKVALDDLGKSVTEDQKKAIKVVDVNRKSMRDTLDAWRDEVRAPLTEWEQLEKDRVARLEASLEALKAIGLGLELLTADEIRGRLAQFGAVTVDDSWEEYEVEAARVALKMGAALDDALTRRVDHEEQLAQIAAFQAEKLKRDTEEHYRVLAEQAAESARVDAEQKAAAAAAAAAKREADIQAENDRLRQQLEQKKLVQDAEAKAREGDRAHRHAVHLGIMNMLIEAGMHRDDASELVKKIRDGGISHLQINY